MAEAGLYGVGVPAAYGGREGSAREMVRVIEEIARADGAAGWCLMIGATTGLLAASLSDAWARKIYGSDSGVITCGVTAASGRPRPVPGGHLVSGRWAFASGVRQSDWVVGGAVMTDGRDPIPGRHGAPQTHLVFFEPGQIQVLDTWHASGLRGSGSHDFEASDAFVPEGRSVELGSHPRVDGPLYRFPTLALLALGVCGVSLGIARRALEEFAALAAQKVPTASSRPLAQRSSAQRSVGEAEVVQRATLLSARREPCGNAQSMQSRFRS